MIPQFNIVTISSDNRLDQTKRGRAPTAFIQNVFEIVVPFILLPFSQVFLQLNIVRIYAQTISTKTSSFRTKYKTLPLKMNSHKKNFFFAISSYSSSNRTYGVIRSLRRGRRAFWLFFGGGSVSLLPFSSLLFSSSSHIDPGMPSWPVVGAERDREEHLFEFYWAGWERNRKKVSQE